MSALGIHYPKAKVIKMLYHSLLPFPQALFNHHVRQGVNSFGERYLVGMGTIAKGIYGVEPLLSENQLDKDLEVAKAAGVKEVVIFRLGGLNKKYLQVIKRHAGK